MFKQEGITAVAAEPRGGQLAPNSLTMTVLSSFNMRHSDRMQTLSIISEWPNSSWHKKKSFECQGRWFKTGTPVFWLKEVQILCSLLRQFFFFMPSYVKTVGSLWLENVSFGGHWTSKWLSSSCWTRTPNNRNCKSAFFHLELWADSWSTTTGTFILRLWWDLIQQPCAWKSVVLATELSVDWSSTWPVYSSVLW